MNEYQPFEEWMKKFGKSFDPYTLSSMYRQRCDYAFARVNELMELDSLPIQLAVNVVRHTMMAGYTLEAYRETKKLRDNRK